MLEPQSRMALTEQLAPPPGFELLHAVGTTFTLELETALGIPLSFASRRISADDGELGIFEAVRRATDRVDIFAQAGALTEGTRSKLLAFLEPMIHPVTVPPGTLFHPKVWFLEYGSGEERAYRFLCASRNLTADRSWDLLVRLDGFVTEGEDLAAAGELNAPLVTFLKSLPGRAVRELGNQRSGRIDGLAVRWAGIEWEDPAGLDLVGFHAFGLPKPATPDLKGTRALVISPFVSDWGLAELRREITQETVLLSRAESLDRLEPTSIDNALDTRILDEMAIEEDRHETSVERLTGLHAKLVVIDYHRTSWLFVGSSNATEAGWSNNVEVMVEFQGSKAKVGVDAILKSLTDITQQYSATGGEPEEENEQTRRKLDRVLRELAGLRLTVTVIGSGPFDLWVTTSSRLENVLEDVPDDVTLGWRLLRQKDDRQLYELTQDGGAEVTNVGLVDVTPFIELSATHSDGTRRRALALARLEGDPAERRQAILADQVKDQESFVRLLTLMLELTRFGSDATWRFDHTGLLGLTDADPGAGIGLFEALLRAVAVGHGGLAEAKNFIDYLSRHNHDGSLIPDGFETLWDAVWAAHELAQGGDS
ncbi:hypothetical protein G6027_17405 [Dietzia sp. SLG310A2-38A2]|uniref:phospholipase D family protein n=1 Tax=Dietzia sp. SLG310A2-38A2 TaxID=1630643 RepID=UPI0015F9CABA|nr:phospholipase D family protein [Dietzia sp. SLG310A2-38A2]MBB1032616.1 hypothetical protein [Dietzia sp. SLG310A2-38A2]